MVGMVFGNIEMMSLRIAKGRFTSSKLVSSKQIMANSPEVTRCIYCWLWTFKPKMVWLHNPSKSISDFFAIVLPWATWVPQCSVLFCLLPVHMLPVIMLVLDFVLGMLKSQLIIAHMFFVYLLNETFIKTLFSAKTLSDCPGNTLYYKCWWWYPPRMSVIIYRYSICEWPYSIKKCHI